MEVAVLEFEIGEDPWATVGDTVADAAALGNDGGEVGELFELLPFGWAVDAGHEGLEFGLQFLDDVGF